MFRKYVPIVLILVLAFGLRLPLINGSFWLDEAAQVLESRRSFFEQHLILDDFQPPLLHYITHFMLYVSQSEIWLRQISVIAGLGTIYFVYKLVEQSHGKQRASIASILLATSSFHIFFSQELRPYSLATMFATASWFYLLQAITNKSKQAWSIFTLASVLGLYSMYVYPFILISQCIYVFIHRKDAFKNFLLALCAVGIFGLPWLPTFIGQLRVGTMLTTQLPGWSEAVSVPQLKALPLTLAKFFTGQVQLQGSPVLMFLFSLPILLFFFSAYNARKDKKSLLYLYWFFIPVMGAWLISFVVPVIAPKRLMVSLPAMFIIFSVTPELMRTKYLRQFVFLSVLTINIVTTFLYYSTPAYQREDWRSIVSQIESESKDGSVALFSFPDAFAPWKIYSKGSISAMTTKRILITSTADLPSDFDSITNYTTVYVFDYLRDLTDPNSILDTWLEENGYLQTQLIDGKHIGFIRVYERVGYTYVGIPLRPALAGLR